MGMFRFTLLALVLSAPVHAAPFITPKLNPAAAKKAAGAIALQILPLGVVPPGFLNNKPPFDEGDALGALVLAPKGPPPVLPGLAVAEIPVSPLAPVFSVHNLENPLKINFDGSFSRRERDFVPAE
jgi:hypothetical protein